MRETEERYSNGCIKYARDCITCGKEFLGKKSRKSSNCNLCASRQAAHVGSAHVKSRAETKNKQRLKELRVFAEGATKEALNELFEYQKEGVLTYRVSVSNKSLKGTIAGSWASNGYKYVSINKKKYLVHRLVYIYHNGHIKEGMYIDHKDRDTTNNKIQNLREVTPAENIQNQLPKGYVRVKGMYVARIRIDDKVIQLGSFNSPEEAQETYYAAKAKYHI